MATADLKRDDELCGKNRVHRIMRSEGLPAVRGYRRHPGFKGGKRHPAAENILNKAFEVTQPDQVRVTDFTYIRTYEGWLYLTVVIDLFSRKVIGWTMKSSPKTDLVIDALLMAIWVEDQQQRFLFIQIKGFNIPQVTGVGSLRIIIWKPV